MAPAVIIDNTPDFGTDDFQAPLKSASDANTPRTLLLAPPSVASHPDALSRVAEAYDRNATDIQMLDRLAMGLVALPPTIYDAVLILTDVDQTRQESSRLLNREVMERIVQSLKPGGRLKSQDGAFGRFPGAEQTEAILSGLVKSEDDGMIKPETSAAPQTVKLSFGKKKANAAAVPANAVEASTAEKRKSDDTPTGSGDLAQNGSNGVVKATPAGVGFIDSNDDFDGGYDDGSGYDDEDDEFPSDEQLQNAGTIDPDTLLTEEDRMRPLDIRKSYQIWRALTAC